MSVNAVEGCKLLQNAKILAEKRGLPPEQVVCYFAQACLVTSCNIILDPPADKPGRQQVNKFYERLERARVLQTGSKQ